MIDMASRLRIARGIAKNETLASIIVFETLKKRGHPDAPPATISDGWGGIGNAMVEVYGKTPEYSGRGRPPTRKQPQAGWKYLQMVKKRDENGSLLDIELRAIFGELDELVELLGKSTAYVERTHLTMRHFSSRLVRKTLAFSKLVEMHQAAATWDDLCYNLTHQHKSLRIKVFGDPNRRWIPRTPAMAAGLTDHVWDVREILYSIPLPNNTW